MRPKLQFYHSFPRHKGNPGAALDSQALRRGMLIFESILRFGILLVPEILEFIGELDDEGVRGAPILAFQRRLCLTQISEGELLDHGKLFGNFHIAFSNQSARRLGAIPVIYIPQPIEKEEVSLALLGNTLVYRLREIQNLLEEMARLKELSESGLADETAGLMCHSEDETPGGVSAADLARILRVIKGEKQDYSSLAAATKVMSSLFYPTEYHAVDDLESLGRGRRAAVEALWYYRQREWRIIGGIILDGRQVDRDLTMPEVDHLMKVDKRFFGRQIDLPEGVMSLVNGCRIISHCQGRRICEFIEEVIVPKEVEEEACERARRLGATIKIRSLKG